MASEKSIWQQIGLHNWLLKKEGEEMKISARTLTPDDIYNYIVKKFEASIQELSFANRVVFYHEYIVCFNGNDFQDFMNSKKGIFGLIIQESVKQFYIILADYHAQGKTVVPSANKWVFRFVSSPTYSQGDIGFIGKLLPGASQAAQENLRVTYIPRQTGIAQNFDVHDDMLSNFTFYSDGYYELAYQDNFSGDGKTPVASRQDVLCRLETVVPDKMYAGKKVEYVMTTDDILVSADESHDTSAVFCIPSEWVNAPHLRIRFDRDEQKFYCSSFGEKTMLNEQEVERSDEANPAWVELPVNSKLVLNGIVGINIFKN
ncbi:MAG: hypothetical protein ABIT96_02285 [Ferruginibacter sp.]